MPNVLLVADDPEATRTWQQALEACGYRVFTAADSRAALQTVIHESIDVIAAPASGADPAHTAMCETVCFAAAEMFIPSVAVMMGAVRQAEQALAVDDAALLSETADVRKLVTSVQMLLQAKQLH